MDKMPVTGRIFVSYRRDDSAYPTGWLTDRLVEHYGQQQVFTDVDSIELGDDFAKKITKAVASCDVLLAVIGPTWLTAADENGERRLEDPNDYVRIEIEAALRRQVLVVPILVDGARMPRVSDLPGSPAVPGDEPETHSLATLPYREALALHPEQFDWAVGKLLTKLDEVLADPGTRRRQPRPVPVPKPKPRSDEAFAPGLRWGLVGLLTASLVLLLVALPSIFDDLRAARHFQPDTDEWLAFLWLLPGLVALVSAVLVYRGKPSTLGTMLGLTAAAAWMVAESWAAFHDRTEPHHVVHTVLVLLLLAAAVGIATSARLRERLHSNHLLQAVVALFLAVLGFLVHSQADRLAKAVTGDSAGTLPLALDSEPWLVRVDSLIPFLLCAIAAVVLGNSDQTRALRTCIGVILMYQVGIRATSLYRDFTDEGADLTAWVGSVLIVAGCLLLWWAVCVGQPKKREVRWQAQHSRHTPAMP
ncbi:MAG: toll/interleukin-1 receptor domain-containing protein [Nocardioidaceae bacterium]|nr:toll/interleukin-1 receptor domain-containing protein [Nocardioidaceae bacterium]